MGITNVHVRTGLRWIIAAFFLYAGTYHFLRADLFEHMMPSWIPFHSFLVAFTGLCELAAGLGLLIKKLWTPVRICLVVFLLAVFPVNINMAFNHDLVPTVPQWFLWVRLPLQFVLIAGILWCTATAKTPTTAGCSEEHTH